MGDGTSAAAVAAHCVQSEESAVVLEKMWTQEGGLEDLYEGEWLTFLSGVSYLYSGVAARPGWHK